MRESERSGRFLGKVPFQQAFHRSRSSSISSFDRLAISAASATHRHSRGSPLHKRFPRVSCDLQVSRSPCVVLLWARSDRSNDTHMARFATFSQSASLELYSAENRPKSRANSAI